MPEERIDEHLRQIDDADELAAANFADLPASVQALIEADYQRRRAEFDRQMARFEKMEAERARLDAEMDALMTEMGW